MKKRVVILQIAAALACGALAGTAVAQRKEPTAAEHRQQLNEDVKNAIAKYRKTDPNIERFFSQSAGYVVFPRVGKFGFIVSGAHGDGVVFDKGKAVGSASITIASVGLTAGVQEFSEIIFFENDAAISRFKENKFEFAAGASAVIVTAGAGKSNNYRDGVVVFAQPSGGAMAELSLGTQKFNFKADGAPAK
jgi:lipid-binding SYLF domain-containing protein